MLPLLARLQANAGNLLDALTMQRSASAATVAAGNRLSIAGHLLFLAEIVGNAGIEPEVVGVVEGIVTLQFRNEHGSRRWARTRDP